MPRAFSLFYKGTREAFLALDVVPVDLQVTRPAHRALVDARTNRRVRLCVTGMEHDERTQRVTFVRFYRNGVLRVASGSDDCDALCCTSYEVAFKRADGTYAPPSYEWRAP